MTAEIRREVAVDAVVVRKWCVGIGAVICIVAAAG